jgi:hypothetical protein
VRDIAKVNEHPAAGRYLGPVFWDIGGIQRDLPADWACWSKVTMDRCIDGYIAGRSSRSAASCSRTTSTRRRSTGKGSANGRSLIQEMRAKGFKFVGIRSHEAVVQTFGQQQEQLSSSTEVTIDAQVTHQSGGRVVVDIRTEGDAKIVVAFDSQSPTAEFRGNKQIDVTPRRAALQTVSDRSRRFDPEAGALHVRHYRRPPDAEGQTDDHSVCELRPTHARRHSRSSSRGRVRRARLVRRSLASVTRTTARRASLRTRMARRPFARPAAPSGASNTTPFTADRNDVSKMSLILEQGTGHIVTGKRHAFKNASGQAVNRKEVPFSETAIDCDEGIWHGVFEYANGSKEEFLFRKPNANEPEYNER